MLSLLKYMLHDAIFAHKNTLYMYGDIKLLRRIIIWQMTQWQSVQALAQAMA